MGDLQGHGLKQKQYNTRKRKKEEKEAKTTFAGREHFKSVTDISFLATAVLLFGCFYCELLYCSLQVTYMVSGFISYEYLQLQGEKKTKEEKNSNFTYQLMGSYLAVTESEQVLGVAAVDSLAKTLTQR